MNQRRKLRVAVLFGGRSAEHEISLLSARFVISSLDPERYEVIPVGIDKQGRWLLQDAALLLEGPRDPRLAKLHATMPHVSLAAQPGAFGEHLVTVDRSESLPFDVVFPVLHGPLGEDGALQGLLELASVPYVGSGVLGSAVGMDKDVMKRLLLQAGLPVLGYEAVRHGEWTRSPEAVRQRLAALGFPQFVKPANLGSSVGVSRVERSEELDAALVHAFEFDDKLVVERGLSAPREIECAVLGGESSRASIPGEVRVAHADGFYSYSAKYVDESGAQLLIPAELTAEQTSAVQALALEVYRVLDTEGLARVDMFLTPEGELYVNEINTMPGFTAISMFPQLWLASGVEPRALMDELIVDALARGQRRHARRSTP